MPRKKSKNDRNPPTSLRERAQELLHASRTDIAAMTTEDVQCLVHELQIHQVELELQNEELRDAQVELAQIGDRYADLYEFAPVGYVTLDREGKILEANLTLARMLGVARSELAGKRLSNFIACRSQDVFYLHQQDVFATAAKRTCELEMGRGDQHWVARLETTTRPDENGAIGQCRTAISDVSQTIDRIQQEIQQRFDASPSFFMLARETPRIVENLWRQAEFAYLDNPLPSLFKEKLLTYLSRFCRVPYCMARHGAFLMRVGRVAGDPDVEAMPAAEVLAMLEKPFPSDDELNRNQARLRDSPQQQSWPKPGSALEDAVFLGCIPIFLGLSGRSGTFAKPRTLDDLQTELHRVLGPTWYDELMLLLSFVRSTHFWTETHSQITRDSDVEALLSEQQSLADWIASYHNSVGQELQQLVEAELAELAGTHAQLSESFEAFQASFLRRMSKLFADSTDAIFIKDLSGRIIDMNAAAQRQYGWTRDELIGRSIKTLVPPKEHEHRDELMARCLRGEEVRSVEVSRVTKSGDVLPILLTLSLLTDECGRPTGIATIAEDIARLKQAEEGLRGEHQLSESIIGTAQHIVLVLDTEACIVRFNTYFEQLTGWQLDEVQGRDWFDTFLPEQSRVEARSLFDRAIRGERTRGTFNVILTKGGLEREIEWYDAPLTSSEGELTGLLSTGLDVTERRALECHLLEIANEEQRRIGQDLHDGVGQELTGLGMMADALWTSLTRKAASEAKIAEKLTEGLHRAVGHVRALARGLNPVEIDPGGLRSALEVLTQRATILYGIPCVFDCVRDVLVDDPEVSTQLYRIAQEAMNNAVKHGNSTELRITLARNDDDLVLQVQDNGRGIQAGSEPGLGLRSMGYRAEVIGGQLLVQPRDNGGTIVRCSVNSPASAA